MKTLRFVVLFVLLAVVALPAFAQDTLGLSDSDAALLNTANETSSAFDTVTYDFVLSLDFAGEFSGLINGTGVIDNTNSVFSLTVDGSLTVSGETQPAALEVRVFGDTLFLNLGGQWFTGSLSELVAQAEGMASGMGGDMLPVNPADLASGDMSGLMEDPAMMQALSGLATLQPEDFISITRNADDAQGRAAFQIAINIAELLSNEGISALLGGAVGGSMGGGSEMTAEQAAQMGQMFAMMFSGSTFTIDQFVNTSSNLVERTVVDLSLDLGMMMGGAAGSADSTIALNFAIDLSNYNQPVSVEQPTDAQPLEELMGGMGMMMGS